MQIQFQEPNHLKDTHMNKIERTVFHVCYFSNVPCTQVNVEGVRIKEHYTKTETRNDRRKKQEVEKRQCERSAATDSSTESNSTNYKTVSNTKRRRRPQRHERNNEKR